MTRCATPCSTAASECARCLFTPLANGQVEVVYEAHADPGGGLPSWLVNSFVVDAPLNTLRGLREKIGKEVYQSASRAYISEI